MSRTAAANYFYFQDAAGNFLQNPQQFIEYTNHFRKLSQELRFASPADQPFRVIAGLFYQRQNNFIHQDYKVDNLAPLLSVNGFPGTCGSRSKSARTRTMRSSAKRAST